MSENTVNENVLDLSDLSEEARGEIVDFYEFITQKYGRVRDSKKDISHLVSRRVTSFEKINRDEMYER